jgi:hypothetical protein
MDMGQHRVDGREWVDEEYADIGFGSEQDPVPGIDSAGVSSGGGHVHPALATDRQWTAGVGRQGDQLGGHG